MRKNKILELIKAKGFYAVLLLCFIAIALMAGVYVMSTSDKNKNLVDLNEPTEIETGENGNDNVDTRQEEKDILDVQNIYEPENNYQADLENEQVGEQPGVYNRYDEYVEIFEDETDVTTEEITEEKTEAKTVTDKAEDKEAQEVVKEVAGTSVQSDLSFSGKEELSWPVQGNVVLNYSMNSTIYFPSLDQYKCNPAIIISAKVGDEVKSSAKGIIDSVENIPETGLTVTVSIGNNYKLIYGQLYDVNLKVGDLVEVGDVIGKIAEPTGYYELEGANLYFKVQKKGESINPMTLLQ